MAHHVMPAPIQLTPPLTLIPRPLQQPFRFDLQSLGNAHYNEKAGIAPSALDATDVGEVDASFEAELLLRQPGDLTQPPDISANDVAPIVHA